jgi:hypothetical protein
MCCTGALLAGDPASFKTVFAGPLKLGLLTAVPQLGQKAALGRSVAPQRGHVLTVATVSTGLGDCIGGLAATSGVPWAALSFAF